MTDTPNASGITRTRKTLPATNTSRLKDRHGATKAAELLGITPSGLHTMIDRGVCSATVEILAGRLLQEQGERPSRDRLLIIKVTPTQMDGLRPVIEAFGARIAFADEA